MPYLTFSIMIDKGYRKRMDVCNDYDALILRNVSVKVTK